MTIDTEIGILTLSTIRDWPKAVLLLHSAKIHNPGLPVAVAADAQALPILKQFPFDFVIPQRTDVQGFAQKLQMDAYSPFELTLFFDADIIITGSVDRIIPQAKEKKFLVEGKILPKTLPPDQHPDNFGFNFDFTMKHLELEKLYWSDGVGAYYFEKKKGGEVFAKAREMLARRSEWTKSTTIADEELISIVCTLMDIEPNPLTDDTAFFGSPWHAEDSSIRFDSQNVTVTYRNKSGYDVSNCVYFHFMNRGFPNLYWNIWRGVLRDQPMGIKLQGAKRWLGELYYNIKLNIRDKIRS